MVSFGKAALALSFMSTFMGFTLGEDTEVVLGKTRRLKGSGAGPTSKGSKAGGMEIDTESWRFSSTAFYYEQLAQIPNDQVKQQLAQFNVIPVGGPGEGAAFLLTALGGSNACIPGNPGVGSDGQFTEAVCDRLEKVLAFWSLDPAIDQAQLRKIEIRGVSGKIYENTPLLNQVFGVSPSITPEVITGLQNAVRTFLPGNFSNPLLSLYTAQTGELTTTGTIGIPYRSFDGVQSFVLLPVPSILLGEGILGLVERAGEAGRLRIDKQVVTLFSQYLVSLVEPVDVATMPELNGASALTLNLVGKRLGVNMDVLTGYFFARNMGDMNSNSFCELLENTRRFESADGVCGLIVGARLAAIDGDNVDATKAVEFASANYFKILAADPGICPTPPGCFAG